MICLIPLLTLGILGTGTTAVLMGALTISNGDPMIFIERPVSFVFLLIAVLWGKSDRQ